MGNILHFAASKKHIGFYPGPQVVAEFKGELGKYSVDKGTIRIPYGNIDTDLIKKLFSGVGPLEIMHKYRNKDSQ